ncbi:hypothetical protein MHBO_003477 [Bonamia ostreae]|uniref:Uncharacterized protein n=1 Tax=Bonamia ostreae TaxID=126728 RepID=A0ABV2ARG9_9EUKA
MLTKPAEAGIRVVCCLLRIYCLKVFPFLHRIPPKWGYVIRVKHGSHSSGPAIKTLAS